MFASESDFGGGWSLVYRPIEATGWGRCRWHGPCKVGEATWRTPPIFLGEVATVRFENARPRQYRAPERGALYQLVCFTREMQFNTVKAG